MSTSELNERQPIFRFLGPTSTQAATFSQPTESAFNDPTSGRELGFAGNRTGFKDRFSATATMFNVGHITFLLDELMHIWKIIASIQTHMLLNLIRVRAGHDDGDNHFIDQPFVVDVGSRDVHCQRRATPVHENVNFAAALAAVYRTLARVGTAQWRWTRYAVDSLPCPFNPSSLLVKTDEFAHQLLEDAALLPFLKTLMQGAATHSKPAPMNRFPLATRPHHIPNPIHHLSVIRSLSPWPFSRWLLRQYASQPSPQWTWHLKIIDSFRFLCMILAQDVSVRFVVLRLQCERDTSSFSILSSSHG